MDLEQRDDITEDTISGGDLTIYQRREGYRFGLDGVLLSTDLPDLPDAPTIVDLGSGQGIVALCLASRFPDARVLAVERQDSLFELLEANIAANGLEGRVDPLQADLRNFRGHLQAHTADLVVCNPPYYRKGERRTSDDAEKAAARNELAGTLADFIDAAAYVLDQRGYLKVILPPLRMGDLFGAVEATDLSFAWTRFFHSRDGEDAYLMESVLRRGGAADIRVRAPLVVYDGENYGPEVQDRIDRAAAPVDEA
jgi:tRNA1Val (adenine37-N6)-methyltransferase